MLAVLAHTAHSISLVQANFHDWVPVAKQPHLPSLVIKFVFAVTLFVFHMVSTRRQDLGVHIENLLYLYNYKRHDIQVPICSVLCSVVNLKIVHCYGIKGWCIFVTSIHMHHLPWYHLLLPAHLIYPLCRILHQLVPSPNYATKFQWPPLVFYNVTHPSYVSSAKICFTEISINRKILASCPMLYDFRWG